MNALLQALGHTKPVYWYVPNHGGQSFEVDNVDVDYAKRANFGVFYAVNILGDTPNAKGNRRYEGNAIRPTACFVDFDTGTKAEQTEKINALKLKPSAIVESGRGYHVYWFLSDGDFTLWRRIQRSLARSLGGDIACQDPARLLRLPGSWHTKAEPMLVSLWELNSQRYTLAELELFCPSEPEPTHFSSSWNIDTHGGWNTPTLTPYLVATGERHAELLKITARHLRGVAPMNLPERIAEIKAWYIASSKPLKENWEAEVDQTVSWILNRELPGYGT